MSSTRPVRPRPRPSAAEKIAAQRAAQQRRQRIRLALAGIAAVIAVFATLLIVKVANGNAGHADVNAQAPAASVTDQVVTAATHVHTPTFAAIGSGTVSNPPIHTSGANALTADGKPQIIYLGYEWCPYCAAQRWALVVALSRFGTFSGLGLTQSASDDVYPSTHTFTFAHATYTSRYLAFTPVEMQDANRKPLQTPTAAEQQLVSVYDAPPYVPASSSGGLPFTDMGGRYVISGASYSPQVLAGQSWQQIATALSDPNSADARAIDGSANALTAALCTLTGSQPAAVCSSPGVAAAKGALR
jgi:hypothetical protein